MGLAELEFTRKLIELGKQLNELQDEITRLRAHMPADVLREFDRRKNLRRQSVDTSPSDTGSRSGSLAAAQEVVYEWGRVLTTFYPPGRWRWEKEFDRRRRSK